MKTKWWQTQIIRHVVLAVSYSRVNFAFKIYATVCSKWLPKISRFIIQNVSIGLELTFKLVPVRVFVISLLLGHWVFFSAFTKYLFVSLCVVVDFCWFSSSQTFPILFQMLTLEVEKTILIFYVNLSFLLRTYTFFIYLYVVMFAWAIVRFWAFHKRFFIANGYKIFIETK